MGWILRLVETETDSPGSGVDVMEIRPTRDLGDIAHLGLTLPETKQLLARVQQAVVAAQARRAPTCCCRFGVRSTTARSAPDSATCLSRSRPPRRH